MTKENILLFLRIYDKCLKYGNVSPKYAFPNDQIPVKTIFEHNLKNNNLHLALSVFSTEQNNWSREVLLYFVYRLNLFSRSEFTDLFFTVYGMTDANTSLFTYFPYATIIAMFEKAATPFISRDPYNNFDELKENLTIYRGIRNRPKDINRCGFSWTLERKTAERFSFMDNETNVAFIVSGQVSKETIFGYLTNRGESEIIIAAELVENKVITRIEVTIQDVKNVLIETIVTD
ncbi:hypothetical protein D3C85_401220 [compost metagenome]